MTPATGLHPEPPADARPILASRVKGLAARATAAERIRVLALLRAARDVDAPLEELERAIVHGEDPGAASAG